jgi:hypothetical protein
MGGQKIHSIKPKAISQAFGFVEYIFAAGGFLSCRQFLWVSGGNLTKMEANTAYWGFRD